MKIVIDGRMYRESGIGRYIRNLISNLQILDTKNEYFILFLEEEFKDIKLKKNFKKILTDFKWYGISEQIKLPKILNRLKPDLVHFPHFNVPFFYEGKFIVTIHDLIHQHFQMRRVTTLNPIIYKIKQLGYDKIFQFSVKKSEKILVPSNFVKDLIVNKWRINPDKIVVTYEAVDNQILNLSRKLNQEKLLEKFGIKPPFIFYVGNAHPHKNVEGLIGVFRQLREKYRYLQLVLAGHDHYFWQRIKRQYRKEGIIYTGQVNDRELVALYKSAKCFVMPSFEEGFGIPILEAMACGTPVVSSNAGALKEIGKEAGIYFDPADLGDMTEKISMVLNSEKIRLNLISKGGKRVKDFSWKKLAKQTLEVYSQCE